MGDDSSLRPWRQSAWFGLAVGLVALAVAVAIVALPLFALAAYAEPESGLNRPLVRAGLVRIALPVGAVAGLTVGVASARWRRRGGTIPSADR